MKFFRDFYGDFKDDPYRHLRFSTTARSLLPEPELLRVLGEAFVKVHALSAQRAGKLRWADKEPENVLYLREWGELLGDGWLFVHMVRNPLDTLASMKEAGFPKSLPGDFDGRIKLYRRCLTEGLNFAGQNPERSYLLAYEKLVAQPETALSDLMGWLGERLDPAQLEFNRVSHDVGLEDPKVGATSGVHSTSVGTWASKLSAAEVAAIRDNLAALWGEVYPENQANRYCNG